jgi:hypothetical protein
VHVRFSFLEPLETQGRIVGHMTGSAVKINVLTIENVILVCLQLTKRALREASNSRELL